MSMTRRSALVAGGAGFLGSHLCDRLIADGYRVVCLDSMITGNRGNISHLLEHPDFELAESDIVQTLPAEVTHQRFDEIYNLACAASPPAYQRDPEHTLLTSVVGTRHLLQLAQAHSARFLLTSTSEVYGDPLEHPQRESYRGNVNPTGPRACYDEGKRAAETLAFDYERAGRAHVRVVRIFNTYGPRLDPRDGRVVSNFIVQALTGRPLTLYGDGQQTRSFCYVTDLIEGLVRAMRYGGAQPGPINLGNPEEITVRQLAETIAELTHVGFWSAAHPLPVDDPGRRRPDITLAGRILGWQPQTSLEHGLQKTIDWFAGMTSTVEAVTPEAQLACRA